MTKVSNEKLMELLFRKLNPEDQEELLGKVHEQYIGCDSIFEGNDEAKKRLEIAKSKTATRALEQAQLQHTLNYRIVDGKYRFHYDDPEFYEALKRAGKHLMPIHRANKRAFGGVSLLAKSDSENETGEALESLFTPEKFKCKEGK